MKIMHIGLGNWHEAIDIIISMDEANKYVFCAHESTIDAFVDRTVQPHHLWYVRSRAIAITGCKYMNTIFSWNRYAMGGWIERLRHTEWMQCQRIYERALHLSLLVFTCMSVWVENTHKFIAHTYSYIYCINIFCCAHIYYLLW